MSAYEPYSGDTFSIPLNKPTKIPLLSGVNTLFADEDVTLDVKYEKVETVEGNDITITGAMANSNGEMIVKANPNIQKGTSAEWVGGAGY